MSDVRKAEGAQDQETEAQELKVDLVGTRVREIREYLGRSVEETAQTAGMTQAVLEAIEGGTRDATASELRRIAEALGVPFPQLFGTLSPAALLLGMAFDEAPGEIQEAVRTILKAASWAKA
jgi:transcriptional regulator with XRE-family HTH domain